MSTIRAKDRSRLCAFTFADGRQCRTPRRSGHLHLCYFHAQKEAESLAAQQVGQDICRFLPTKLLTACDLGVAMSRLFCAVAHGQVKPKVASTLAYLAQTMLQSIPIARHEYIESFNTNTWRNAVRVSFRYEDEANTSAPQPASKPPASSVSVPTAKPTSSPAPQHSPQPAPSPHTPLPPTSTEFAQQLLAGRNSSRSELPTQFRPGREPGSSSSLAPSSDSAPAFASSTQPAPSSPSKLPTPNNSQPAPTPPAPQPTSPQQSQPTQNSQHNSPPAPAAPALTPPVPPGFGAPANWDVLIPPQTAPQILPPVAVARITSQSRLPFLAAHSTLLLTPFRINTSKSL